MMIDLAELRRLTEAYQSAIVEQEEKGIYPGDYADKYESYADVVENPANIIELLDRLDRAEKVCNMMRQNTGMHCAAVGKCMECQKESTPHLQMYCRKCIDKALAEWRGE